MFCKNGKYLVLLFVSLVVIRLRSVCEIPSKVEVGRIPKLTYCWQTVLDVVEMGKENRWMIANATAVNKQAPSMAIGTICIPKRPAMPSS